MKRLISFIKDLLAFFFTDLPPELDEGHADTRYAMQESKIRRINEMATLKLNAYFDEASKTLIVKKENRFCTMNPETGRLMDLPVACKTVQNALLITEQIIGLTNWLNKKSIK